jgi:hypothetical protein
MERGFLAGVDWWRGAAADSRDTKAFWGPKLRTDVYEVLSFRCVECGHLELRTGEQTGKPGDGLAPG